jgi:hypothetical protein
MFSRASQPSSSSNAVPSQEFQEDVEDLYADNLISGQRAARLLTKACKAGIKGISKKVRKTTGRNQARAITRHKLTRTKWPDYYYFDCRVQDRKTATEYTTRIPINLPLELLEMLWELGLAEVLLSTDNLDTDGKKHMAWMKEQLQVDELWGWGLHGDGIPCNYDRTESVIMISLNLPGLKGKNGRMRIPLVVLPDFAVSENTFDDIFTVIAWSMRHLVAGSRPCCRHDGTAWGKTDSKRKKKNNAPLKFRACLVQVRADWDWMGKCFHLPFHNVLEGMCWLCRCKRHQVSFFVLFHNGALGPHECRHVPCASGCTYGILEAHHSWAWKPIIHGLGSPSHEPTNKMTLQVCEASDAAEWRSQRLSTMELLQREWERGKMPSPIFACFGIFNYLFKCDWLHCADQGVGADFLGNLFAYLVQHKMPGPNIEDRSKALGVHIEKYYEANDVEDRLKEFLPKTFQSEKKTTRPPRLKGNAASVRALIGFGDQMAKQFLSDADPTEAAMKAAAHHLLNCYNSLREANKAFSHDALYNSSKNFALQYDALHEAFGGGVPWRPMPKMHLFLELCSSGTEPEKFWNYRDEDFGGSVAKQSRMKGMWKKLSAYCKHGLDMFRMKNSAPRIVSFTP